MNIIEKLSSSLERLGSSKKDKGFTLIELLIVIAIIAIIAAAIIIVVNPGQQFQAARNSARWSHMNAIASGIYMYVLDNGDWPPAPCVNDTPGATTSFGDCDGILNPEYIPTIPKDPLTGDDYVIEIIATGTRVQITTLADDGDTPEVTQ